VRQPVHVIVAAATNRVIGRGGQLPWHLPLDLRHFLDTTRGGVLILGRRSFEETGKALPQRTSIVLSRDRAFTAPGCLRAASLAEALAAAEGLGRPVFVCGGEAVYAEALPLADTLILTRVLQEFEGHTRFPPHEHLFGPPVSARRIVDGGVPLSIEVSFRRT
jgi:dihydrofolate reductase